MTDRSEKAGDYLSDVNPFLFEGNGSADPAVYDEFEKAFKKEFKTDRIYKTTAYNWLKRYTVEMKNDAVKEAFETITLKIESENDREKPSDRIYLRFLPEG